MKSTILLLCICTISIYGQRKDKAQTFKIKSALVTDANFDESNGKEINESFARYDANGNAIEEIDYDKKGRIKTHIITEFDTDGNKVKETYLTPKASVEKYIEYKYDNGIKVQKTIYLANGKIKSRKKYVYEFYK